MGDGFIIVIGTIFGTIIGSLLTAFGGYYFGSKQEKQKKDERRKLVASALLFEISQLNKKNDLIKACLNKQSLVSTLYFCLKNHGIFTISSEYSFIADKNPFEVFYADIFDFQSDLDISKLFEYYNHEREANRYLVDLLTYVRNKQKDTYAIVGEEKHKISSTDESMASMYASNCIEHIDEAQKILTNSNVIQELKKICAK